MSPNPTSPASKDESSSNPDILTPSSCRTGSTELYSEATAPTTALSTPECSDRPSLDPDGLALLYTNPTGSKRQKAAPTVTVGRPNENIQAPSVSKRVADKGPVTAEPNPSWQKHGHFQSKWSNCYLHVPGPDGLLQGRGPIFLNYTPPLVPHVTTGVQNKTKTGPALPCLSSVVGVRDLNNRPRPRQNPPLFQQTRQETSRATSADATGEDASNRPATTTPSSSDRAALIENAFTRAMSSAPHSAYRTLPFPVMGGKPAPRYPWGDQNAPAYLGAQPPTTFSVKIDETDRYDGIVRVILESEKRVGYAGTRTAKDVVVTQTGQEDKKYRRILYALMQQADGLEIYWSAVDDIVVRKMRANA